MGRHGYTESDGDSEGDLRVMGWQANVRRAIHGKRGQAFLWELYQALEAMPTRELITGVLMDSQGCACALGAVAIARNIEIPGDLRAVYGPSSHCGNHWVGTLQEDYDSDFDSEGGTGDLLGDLFGIKAMLAQEIMFANDEGPTETDRERWLRMRRWVVNRLDAIP